MRSDWRDKQLPQHVAVSTFSCLLLSGDVGPREKIELRMQIFAQVQQTLVLAQGRKVLAHEMKKVQQRLALVEKREILRQPCVPWEPTSVVTALQNQLGS